MEQYFIKNQKSPLPMVASERLPLIYDSCYASESIILQVASSFT